MAPPAKASDGGQSFAKWPTWGKAAVLAAIVGLIFAVYYFALHLSITSDIRSAEARTRSLERQVREAEERNAEFLRLSEELSARAGIDRANLLALPESAETASFLQDLNRLAELSGLRMQLVEPRPEEPDTHYVRLPVNLRLTGRYHQLARFFYNVSRLDRLISMEDIHLDEPRLQGEEVLLDVDVLATTYRRATQENAAAQGTAQQRTPAGTRGGT
jgi:type IV pilus assembly protein PilO